MSSGAKASSTMVIVWPGGVSAARRGRFTLCSLKGLERASSRCSCGAISFIFMFSFGLLPFGGEYAQDEDHGREHPDDRGVSQRGHVVDKYHGCPAPLVHVVQRHGAGERLQEAR